MANRNEQIAAHAAAVALAQAVEKFAPKPTPPSNSDAMNTARRSVLLAKAKKAIAALPAAQQDVFITMIQLIGG